MNQYTNINSQLEALKLKDIETYFYEKIGNNASIIPKVTPFKGINTDMLYIKDNKLLFIKFMDTTEDLFFILEEELLEVMNEEYELLKIKMEQSKLNIEYNYVFVMPYVDIDDAYKFEDFIENNLIDQTKLEEILTGEVLIDKYLKGKNNEIDLNLFLLKICPEYYVLNDKIHLNNSFKKISFYSDDYKYSATPLSEEQIKDIISINYGNTLLTGGAGTGKTTTLSAKVKYLVDIKHIDPSKILVMSYTKKATLELQKRLQDDLDINCDVTTFHSLGYRYIRKIFDNHKCYIVDNNTKDKIFFDFFAELFQDKSIILEMLNAFKDIPGTEWLFSQYFKENYDKYDTYKDFLEGYKQN